MIALRAIKYKILEYCIEVITEKLLNNFHIGDTTTGTKIHVTEIKTGMYLSEIRSGGKVLRGVRIISVMADQEKLGNNIHFVASFEWQNSVPNSDHYPSPMDFLVDQDYSHWDLYL
jgi:hypothetical protein